MTGVQTCALPISKSFANGILRGTLKTAAGVPYPYTLFAADGRVAITADASGQTGFRRLANLAPGSYVLALDGGGGTTFEVSDSDPALREGSVFVRPEKVTLMPPGTPAGANQLPGVIRHVAFLGNVVRYEVSLADGQIVLSDAANASGTVVRAPGDGVHLGWQAADALFLGA